MNILHHVFGALLVLSFPAAMSLPHGQSRPSVDPDPLVQGAEVALQAYTRASDAYTQDLASPSVAFWSLVIAVCVVLLEWLLSPSRRRR